jgi:hypothetical protein
LVGALFLALHAVALIGVGHLVLLDRSPPAGSRPNLRSAYPAHAQNPGI